MLTSIKLLNISGKTVIDEITIAAIILFMSSCLLSFLSIRRKNNSKRVENAADILFISGLFLLFVTALLFSFNVIT